MYDILLVAICVARPFPGEQASEENGKQSVRVKDPHREVGRVCVYIYIYIYTYTYINISIMFVYVYI